MNSSITQIPPEYIRLPRQNERCQITGLSRATLIELCVPSRKNSFKPKVASRHLKRPGAIRGIRLVHLQSLRDYLGSLKA